MQAVVFCNEQSAARWLSDWLNAHSFPTAFMSARSSQPQRIEIMSQVRTNPSCAQTTPLLVQNRFALGCIASCSSFIQVCSCSNLRWQHFITRQLHFHLRVSSCGFITLMYVPSSDFLMFWQYYMSGVVLMRMLLEFHIYRVHRSSFGKQRSIIREINQ